jgi:two-component system chemotaxis response regulator CheB
VPRDLPAAVFVVLHLPADSRSNLPWILERSGELPVAHARDREPIAPGRAYVAPPDLHLLVEHGHVRTTRGPRENRHRPAVDALFRSAAVVYGPRVVGVVLSGALDDGTAGLSAIKQRGGLAVVQDPADALVSGMPASALEYVRVDHRAPAAEVGPLLERLVRVPAPDASAYPVPRIMEVEHAMAKLDITAVEGEYPSGELSALTCPECTGPMWEILDGDLLRFRCRVGHAYTAESMADGQEDAIEETLWAALNRVEEGALVAERLAARAAEHGRERVAARFARTAEHSRHRAAHIRKALNSDGGERI